MKKKALTYEQGAIRRADSTRKQLAIVFTGDEFGEGGEFILKTLTQQKIKASFFLTGRFYRNPSFKKIIQQLKNSGQFLGAHSDQHILYCDWTKRDSLLVSREEFNKDLDANYEAMKLFTIDKASAKYFLPPYEWYNDTIAAWTRAKALQLINFTAGTLSHADYTTPDLKNYRSSEQIMQSILNYEKSQPSGLNGFILLMHIGAGPSRTDKFYLRLSELISWLREKNYEPIRIDSLLKN
ncbi:MAG TPA: polysaccharide deacetylase family protein [Chitinophagaceae bacterium]|nr:polysaccharide deacetylase family protein [Chitinophagaceae bacterium]